MRKIWDWIKENAGVIAAIGGILLGLTGIIQFGVLNPIHQAFDAINQRFDAVDQRFDAVDQRFDAVDQRFDAQDKRLDDLKVEMNRRFDAQDKHVNQRFDAQDKYIHQRFDAVDQRLERLESDVLELRKLSDRVSRNEGQIDVIRQQLQTADAPSPPN